MNLSQRWSVFTAAPHRVMLFIGALQAVAAMLWWLIELATRYGFIGQPLDLPLPPAAVHAYLMIFGMFPPLMFGFLMTTFPRWMNGSEIPARRYVPAFILLLLGIVGFYIGLLSGRGMLIAATISTLAGWGVGLYALLRVLLDTTHPNKRHPQILFIALCLGWCSLAAYTVWLSNDNDAWLRLAIQGGLWLFLLPVFASVAHRMVPFFTSSALQQAQVPQPYWVWYVMLAGSVSHFLLQLVGAQAWLWLCDAPLAFAALYLSYVWGLRRSLHIPLLAVLHIGFAWLGIAMLLFTAQSLAQFANHDALPLWGLAPLHALTIGCFATILIGMATRVTLGHSGLPMRVNNAVKLLFIGIQLAALLRILADVLEMQARVQWYLAAALIWVVCFGFWGVRYLPAFWTPRADGVAG